MVWKRKIYTLSEPKTFTFPWQRKREKKVSSSLDGHEGKWNADKSKESATYKYVVLTYVLIKC